MTSRRVFVYGETRHKNTDDFESLPSKPQVIKPKQLISKPNTSISGHERNSHDFNNSDYFAQSANTFPKKKVDLTDDIDFEAYLYKDSSNQAPSELKKKANTIYVLRDDKELNDSIGRKYVPAEKKAVNLSRTQSMEWIKPVPSERTYFHELKFDKRMRKQQPITVRCEIEEPVLREKPLPNRECLRNGAIVYK